jgi:hypothetical protein
MEIRILDCILILGIFDRVSVSQILTITGQNFKQISNFPFVKS